MHYHVYILKSLSVERYYIGYSSNLDDRLFRHNSGATKSTRRDRPWIIVYQESYQSKKEALKRERQIKSYKGGKAFKNLIHRGVA